MFCSKCGRQIPDGTVCPCQQPQQPQYQQAPQYQPQPQYQQPQYQARPRPVGPSIIAKFSIDKIIAIFFTILTFGLSFINWFSFDVEGDSVPNFGPYGMDSDMGEVGVGDCSWLFVVVMILMIINIVVFAFYLITGVINLNAMVPALAGVDLHKILHKAFYGILVVCLVLGLIGALVGSFSPLYEDYDEYLEENEKSYEYMEEAFDDDKKAATKLYTEIVEESYKDADKEFDDEVTSADEYFEAMWELQIVENSLAAGWWVTLVFTLIGLVFVLKGDLISSLLKNATAANYQQPYAPQM